MFPNAPDFLESVTGTWNQWGIYVRQVNVQYNDRATLVRGGTLSWWVHVWNGGSLQIRGLYASTAASTFFNHPFTGTISFGGVTFSGLYGVASGVSLERIAFGKWAVVADLSLTFEDCSARW